VIYGNLILDLSDEDWLNLFQNIWVGNLYHLVEKVNSFSLAKNLFQYLQALVGKYIQDHEFYELLD
jgi:hypothetical protein